MGSSKRIFLWSGPRNISTALMYSFAQRKDTAIIDEPLYGHYLSQTPAKGYHPGAREILENMEIDGSKVVEKMVSKTEIPVTFYKNMTHHLVGLDWSFLKEGINIILTRHPEEMLLSFEKVIGTPKMHDVGYQMQVDLLNYLKEINHPIIVLDAKKMLMNPAHQLKNLCRAIGITFDQRMLHWEAGNRAEDGVWAKYWYKNVHQSTGFQAYVPKNAAFPDKLKPLLEECLPCYDALIAYSF
ncbi:MAG: sulfotransferase family protein [Cyclobacteriaceae bacterium]